MVATVVAFTTVAVAAASLGDFALAAVVNLKDEAGIRRRRAVVARGVGGEAVGACVGAEVQQVVELEWDDTSWWGRAYWLPLRWHTFW